MSINEFKESNSNSTSNSSSSTNQVHFKVADVKPEKVVIDSEFNLTKASPILESPKPKNFSSSRSAFVSTCIEAYNQHHDLILRPDDVWLAIANIVQIYINQNAEALRSKFVAFEGKMKLEAFGAGSLKTADYNDLCNQLVNQIKANIKDADFANWIKPSFSTTKPEDELTSNLILMGALKQYFSYKCYLCCGLPSVTLLGTVEDWTQIVKKANKIAEIDVGDQQMIKWQEMLIPVLQKMADSFTNPDLKWWNQIAHFSSGGSGPSLYSGWITVFCPFSDEGEWQADKFEDHYHGLKSQWPIIDSDSLTVGFVEVDVEIQEENAPESKVVTFFAGHLGTQYEETRVQPFSGWEMRLKDDSKNKN